MHFDRSSFNTSAEKKSPKINKFGITITLGFFLIPLVFYLFYYSNFQTEYWIEFFIPAVLLSSYFLIHLYEDKRINFAQQLSFVIVFISLAAFSSFSSLYTLKYPQRGTYPITNLRQVVHYLNKNFKNEKEIFTGAAIIPYLSYIKTLL